MNTMERPSGAIADEKNATPHPWLAKLSQAQREELETGLYHPFKWARELSHLSDTEFALGMIDPALPGIHVKLSKLTPEEVYTACLQERAKVERQRGWMLEADQRRFEQRYAQEEQRRALLDCDDDWRASWEAEKAERAKPVERPPINWPLLPVGIFDEEEEVRAVLAAKNLYAITQEAYGSTWELGCEDAEKVLLEFNKRFAVVKNYGGNCLIVWDEPDVMLDRMVHVKQTFAEFAKAYCNRLVIVAWDKKTGKPIKKPVGTWWPNHPLRRQYERLSFAPGRAPTAGELNLWSGWAVKPKRGTMHESYLEHVRVIICSGNAEHYVYLIKWMARVVQHPSATGDVAVVLRSTEEGTGKGFFAKNFGKLFGRYYLQITNAAHLTGQFNAHLRTVILLFADEAFYAGDNKHKSILKTLITEPHLAIEAKRVDVEASPNCVHLIMASNDPHVVPADESARRFFVLNVSPVAVGDREHFSEIASDLENGGFEDLLGFLQGIDLKGWNHLDVPQTDALKEQKALTVQDGWIDALEDELPKGNGMLRSKAVLDHLGVPLERRGKQCLNRLGNVMRAQDFVSKDVTVDGKTLKWWVRNDKSGAPVPVMVLRSNMPVPF